MTGPRTTDDLIRALVGSPAPPRFVPARAGWAMVAGAAAGLAGFLVLVGLRPDLAAALLDPTVLAKVLVPLALAVLALRLALASSRPGVRLRFWPLALPAVPALALAAQRLAEVPQAALVPEFLGGTALVCLGSITVLSLPPIAAGILMLRRGAPVQPGLSGALLGLAAGGGVAAGYALHCTEDSPLFFVPWYGLGILIAATVGALAGRRLLRW